MKFTTFVKRNYDLFLIIAIAIIYFSLIFNDSVWYDEAYTMSLIKGNLPDIIQGTATDVHPPLYYLIAKFFTVPFGFSVTSVKIASIAPLILVMLFVRQKAKRCFGNKARAISILFSLLIGLIPVSFVMGLEIRMYTWGMFFVTCSGLYAYDLYLNPKNKKVAGFFILFSLAAAYTHYYAALTEYFVYLFLFVALIKQKRCNWRICLIIVFSTVVGYLPWLPTFIRQFFTVKSSWWLTDFTIDSMLNSIKFLFNGNFWTLYVTFITFVIIFSLTSKKNKLFNLAILCIMSFILTVGTGFLISKLIRPFFIDRYMYPACGLLFLGISILIAENQYQKMLGSMLISIIIISTPYSYAASFKSEYKNGTEAFKDFVKNNINANDQIAADTKHLSWPRGVLAYYLPSNEITNQNKDFNGYYFSTNKSADLQLSFPKSHIEKVYNGNIDNQYYFTIYKIADKTDITR